MQQAASVPGTSITSAVLDGQANDKRKRHHLIPEAVENVAMKASGIAYLVGDGAVILAGLAEGKPTGEEFDWKKINWKAIGTGIAFTGGGASCAHYGKPSQNLQTKMVQRHLGDYLRQRGVDLPDDDALKPVEKTKTFVGDLDNYMYAHPDEALGFGGVVGGAMVAADGANIGKGIGRNWMRIGAGGLTSLGGVIGLTVPEQAEPKSSSGQDGRVGWIQRTSEYLSRHPLTVASMAYVTSNGLNLAAVRGDVGQSKVNDWVPRFRALQSGSYLSGNVVLGAATKNQDKTFGVDEAHVETVLRTVDAVLRHQPAETRSTLRKEIAGYLARQPEIKLSAEEIDRRLDDTARSNDSKWTQRVSASAAAGMTRH